MKTELPELTRLSSRGQIVIPTSIRRKMNIKEGTYLAVSAEKDMLVMKKLDAKMKPEDLKTLRLIQEAWEDMEKGRYKVYSVKEFFKELKKW